VKKFFLDHGVKVAGGMALSDGSIGGQFKSFCYTDPLTARSSRAQRNWRRAILTRLFRTISFS